MEQSRISIFVLIGLLAGAFLGFTVAVFALLPTATDVEFNARTIDPRVFSESAQIGYLSLTLAVITGFGALGALAAFSFVTTNLVREKKTKLKAALEVNRTKDEFISMVLHHLRTPISGMRWALKEALKNTDSSDPQRKTMQMLYDESVRALDAVAHLVDASQASVGRIEYALEVISLEALQEVIRQSVGTLEAMAQKRGLTLRTRLAPVSKNLVKVDRRKIAVAVQTLVENSIHYTPSGGSIEVTTQEGDYGFTFQVKDSGIGISPEDQPRIFLQFFRGKNARNLEPGGFGIGLYLVKIFIENHRGEIGFVSEEGRGTTFTFRLPLVRAASEKLLEGIS